MKNTDGFQSLLSLLVHFFDVEKPRSCKQSFFAEENISGHGNLSNCVLFLNNHAHPMIHRINGVGRAVYLSFQIHGSAVGLFNTRKNRGKCRFPRSIFSDQSMNFSFFDRNIDIRKRYSGIKCFAEIFGLT